jgi:hypothetical protein
MTTYHDAQAADGGNRLGDRFNGLGRSLQARAGEAGSRLHEELGHLGETTRDLARSSRRTAARTGRRAAAEVRERPISFGLAAVLGVAAVALLAMPRTRRMAMAGGPLLWNELQKRRSALRF